MGLFSRKEKAPKAEPAINTTQSNASVNSNHSSLRSPPGLRNPLNRSSAASTSPGTPMSPLSPVKLPKIDLPRPPDPQLDPAGYLRSLGAVRERCKIVTDKAFRNELKHFDVDMQKFPDVVSFVSGIIRVRLISFSFFSLFFLCLRDLVRVCNCYVNSAHVTV
jgi:hypothetical protein